MSWLHEQNALVYNVPSYWSLPSSMVIVIFCWCFMVKSFTLEGSFILFYMFSITQRSNYFVILISSLSFRCGTFVLVTETFILKPSHLVLNRSAFIYRFPFPGKRLCNLFITKLALSYRSATREWNWLITYCGITSHVDSSVSLVPFNLWTELTISMEQSFHDKLIVT
jgi:hypothetical protein